MWLAFEFRPGIISAAARQVECQSQGADFFQRQEACELQQRAARLLQDDVWRACLRDVLNVYGLSASRLSGCFPMFWPTGNHPCPELMEADTTYLLSSHAPLGQAMSTTSLDTVNSLLNKVQSGSGDCLATSSPQLPQPHWPGRRGTSPPLTSAPILIRRMDLVSDLKAFAGLRL